MWTNEIPKPLRPVAIVFCVAIAYFLLGRFSQSIATGPSGLCPLWPSAGVAVASTLLFGRFAAVGVAVGSFSTNFFFFSDIVSIQIALINAVIAAIGATAEAGLFALIVRFDKQVEALDYFSRYPRVLRFAFFALIAGAVSPFFGVTALYMTKHVVWSNYAWSWAIWYAADVVGILLFAPLVIGLTTQPQGWAALPSERSRWEPWIFVLAVTGATMVVFQTSRPIASILLLFVIWGCFRYAELYSRIAAVIIALQAEIFTAVGSGQFTMGDEFDRVINVLVYSVVTAVTALSVRAGVIVREDHVERADAKYRSLFDNAVVGIFSASAEGDLIDVNPGLAKITGDESPGDLMARVKNTKRGFYADADTRGRLVAKLKATKDGVLAHETVGILDRNGNRRWVTQHVKELRDTLGKPVPRLGKPILYISVLTDISRERMLFDSATVGISFSSASEDRFLRVNPRLASMHGYRDPEELIAEVESIARDFYADPDERTRFLNKLDRTGQSEKWFRAKTATGRVIRIAESARRLPGSDEILSFMHDVTTLVQNRLHANFVTKVVKALTAGGNLRSVVWDIALTFLQGTEARAVSIWLPSEDGSTLEHAAGYSKDAQTPRKVSLEHLSLDSHDDPARAASAAERMQRAEDPVLVDPMNFFSLDFGPSGSGEQQGSFGLVLLFHPDETSASGGMQLDWVDLEPCVKLLEVAYARFLDIQRRLFGVRRFYDRLPIGVFEADANGRTFYVNKIGRRIEGLTPDEVASGEWYKNLKSEDHREEVLMRWRDHVASKETKTYQADQTFLIDGVETHVEVIADPLLGASGTIEGYIGTIHDMTDYRAEYLEKDTSLKRIRHDLKHSQGVIYNSIAWLKKKGLGPSVRSYLDAIEDALETVELLLGKRGDGDENEFAPDELVRSLFRISVVQSVDDCDLTIQIDKKVPRWVKGPKRALILAANNLVSNAIKYAGNRVDVSLTFEPAAQGQGRLVFSVEDDGPGMSAADAEVVLLVSKDPTARRLLGDDGRERLGLSLSQDVLKPYGSEVAIDGPKNNRFHFGLSVSEAAPPSGAGDFEDVGPVLRSEEMDDFSSAGSVMIVEDDRNMRFLMAQQLLAWNVQPLLVVATAEQAVAAASVVDFSLVLMDVRLEGSAFDGVEASHRIRDSARSRNRKLKILSTSETDRDRDDWHDAWIGKSFLNSPGILRELWLGAGRDALTGPLVNEVDGNLNGILDRLKPREVIELAIDHTGSIALLERWAGRYRGIEDVVRVVCHNLAGQAEIRGLPRLSMLYRKASRADGNLKDCLAELRREDFAYLDAYDRRLGLKTNR